MKKMNVLALMCALTLTGAGLVSAADGSASLPPAPPAGAPGGMPPGGFNPPDKVTQGTAANEITRDTAADGVTYASINDDENALRVTGVKADLSNIRVYKLGGSSSSTEGGDFYGMNAGVLATDKATVNISNSDIFTSAKNGNGLFSYGKGTTVNASHVKIRTDGNNSGGIQTTGGGTTNAENLDVVTKGDSAAAIRSDRGGGTVRVNGGSYVTHGNGSPAIYSTADIAVSDAFLRAENSEAAVIEGKNKIALDNCTLEGSMADTRKMGNQTIHEDNVHNIMIYQSMSGDAEQDESSFTMKGGRIISHKGDVIYVTNTDCRIELSGVKVVNLDKSGEFLRVAGNSATRGWGTAGKNGGTANVKTVSQKIEGNISADTISTLNLDLGMGTSFKGAVLMPENKEGGDKIGSINVTVEKGAVWELTGDSTVTTLTNEGTIIKNGHKLIIAKD